MMDEKKYVTYEQFGAKGDGKTDDLPAIVAAHNYANENGLDVRANDDATYYIGGKALTAKIMTNTYFGKAKFIIDDVKLENIRQNLFNVATSAKRFTPDIKSLVHDQKKVDFPHEGNVYVRVYSNQRKVYIRKGLNMNNGSDASDAFIVDKDGNVLNGINWDYETISSAVAFSVDDEPIVIDGGIFTTIANQWVSKYDYHSRNFNITRSNVTVQNLTHYVEGELDHGAPYSGFLSVGECNNVTLKDCLLTPHKTYQTESKIPGQMVSMGTYDLGFGGSIGVKLINITQTIDIMNSAYWGLMGSNFCKDMHLEGCTISRFDAHCGVTDGSIKNCNLGYMGLNLIGFGNFTVEDSSIFGGNFISFRSDYGSFFHGNLTIKNCEWIPRYGRGNKMYFFGANNTGDHYFGYDCGMPENIVLENVTIKDENISAENLTYYLFPDYDGTFAPGKPYPYGTPKNVSAKLTSNAGREVKICEKAAEYPYLDELVIG